jgi:predicted kinase
VLIMVGIPGAGKTFFAEQFSKTFGAPIVSTHVIEDKLKHLIDPNYDDDTTAESISHLMLHEIFKTGGPIVYEGDTHTRVSRETISKLVRDAGYEPLLVWVQTDTATARKRATKKVRGKTVMDTDDFMRSVKKFTPLNEAERGIVISGKHTYVSQLKILLKRISIEQLTNDKRKPTSQ